MADHTNSTTFKGEDVPSVVPGTISISSELDDSYGVYKGLGPREIDSTEAKRVLRKIDMRIVPILFGTYLLQYLDKNGRKHSMVRERGQHNIDYKSRYQLRQRIWPEERHESSG